MANEQIGTDADELKDPQPSSITTTVISTTNINSNINSDVVASQQEALPGAMLTPTTHNTLTETEEAEVLLPHGEVLKPGWNVLAAEELPRPTYWPVVMGLAVTLFAFGLITTILIVIVGLVLFFISLFGWIGDLQNEQQGEQHHE